MKNTNNKRKTKKEVHSIIVVLNLRDYFAASALQGLMTNVDWCDSAAKYASQYAFEVADAMIAERTKGGAA